MTFAELLENPSFESGISPWEKRGSFNMDISTEHVHQGSKSVKCSGRTDKGQGPSQKVELIPGRHHFFGSFVLIDSSTSTSDTQLVRVKVQLKWNDGSTTYHLVHKNKRTPANDEWQPIGADFPIPDGDLKEALLYVEGPAANVVFFFDDTTLYPIAELSNWREEADDRIEQIRKGNASLQFTVPSNLNAADIDIEIKLKKHHFGFGASFGIDYINAQSQDQYREVIDYFFNWGTIQYFKWRFNRGNKTNPDYTDAINAMHHLVDSGKKVRGHTMFWAKEDKLPDWVKELTVQELIDAVADRIGYITAQTSPNLAHWDVNNELLHGQIYETKTGDPTFTQDHMFKPVHEADPYSQLFLNDYNVVVHNTFTWRFLTQIKKFQDANVGLQGVGVQSHYSLPPDPTLIKHRLDLLSQPGIPIWITEMSLKGSSEEEKADKYETAFRMYFSHPNVHGIIFWCFWDIDSDVDKAFIHGHSFSPDETGDRILDMIKTEWTTSVTQSLAESTQVNFRGFHGEYDIIAKSQGTAIQHFTFTMTPTEGVTSAGFNIESDGSAIVVPEEVSPFGPRVFDRTPTSVNPQTLGQTNYNGQESSLTCVTRSSDTSAVGHQESATVSCNDDEVLTGCSGYLANKDYRRNGEKIIIISGKPVCRSETAYGAQAGVKAIARCCKVQGLSCTYKKAGPSGLLIDDQVEVQCGNAGFALGCAAYSWDVESDESKFKENSCIGQIGSYRAGVDSFAACCDAPNLQCTIVSSNPSGQNIGDMATVSCPTGHVMTGCNVFSQFSRAAGAEITGSGGSSTCVAYNGFKRYKSEPGVVAFASCCHV